MKGELKNARRHDQSNEVRLAHRLERFAPFERGAQINQ
jgi:hypothetical protein